MQDDFFDQNVYEQDFSSAIEDLSSSKKGDSEYLKDFNSLAINRFIEESFRNILFFT